MFRTKKDIDKHVRSTLSRLREDEKNLRGYRISGLYFNIGEYSSALEYVQRYLTANDKNPAAYKVLGQCYEKLKRPDKQLLAYQRSLELDKTQSDLLVEVCKLLQNDEIVGITPAKARYWYELAESRNLQNDTILNLKLKFLSNDGASRNVQEIILKEIIRRPLDAGLRIRLLSYFLEQNRIDEAFKYAFDIEMKQNAPFRNSSDWYSMVSRVLANYKQTNEATLNKNWSYWLLSVCTLERQVFLSLVQSPADRNAIVQNLAEATNSLFQFDQNMNKVASLNISPESEKELASEFLSHHRGQLCLHAATLLFKKELTTTQQTGWHETSRSALPLLLLAYNCGSVKNTQLWLRNANENTKQLIDSWHVQSCFRLTQAGRTLQSCIDTDTGNDSVVLENLRKIYTDKYSVWSNEDDILNEIRRVVSDSDWRKKIYRQLFSNKAHIAAESGSYFLKSKALEVPTFIWPDVSALDAFEETSQQMEPSSLSHLVYLVLGHDSSCSSTSISDLVKCVVFKDLNFSISNLLNCGAETINQLDIDTFLYATGIQAKRSIYVENLQHSSSAAQSTANKPKILPYANMVNRLCTDQQADWWVAAYKVCNNLTGEKLVEYKATLQYGIEAVRGVGDPKMDLIILLKLGQLLYTRSQHSSKAVERGFLEERTEALFKYSLYMLRMQNSSRASIEPYRRLFKYAVASNHSEIDSEINTLSEEAITFLAGRYYKNNEFEELIEDLSGINLPFATYFQAESYRKLTETSNTPKKNKRAYLEKAKDYLSQTLDLLDAPNVDKNHPLKSIVDADIKRLQLESRKLETNQSMSDSFVSANGRSDLDESTVRHQRDVTFGTHVPISNSETIERLIRQMMESLTLLKDDVADVRSKVQTIEEQLNKQQQDTGSVDPLEDYFLLDEDLPQNSQSYLNNTSMYTNVSRNQTSNYRPSNVFAAQQRNAPFGSQQAAVAAALNNPFNMNPLYNNFYGQMPFNPYQAAFASAVSATPNRNQPNFAGVGQVPLQYGSDVFNSNYNLQQQYAAQQLASDIRAPNLIGTLQQPNQSQTPQNQPLTQTSFGFANASINASPVAATTSVLPPSTVSSIQSIDSSQAPTAAPLPVQKQWNPAFNNAPVEKCPPVNVVITSSDPLPPQNTTTVSKPLSLSVTIPLQHIKSTNSSAHQLSSAKANPTITAALQDKPKQSPQKIDAPVKDVKLTAVAAKPPSALEQTTIFTNISKQVSSTPFSSPLAPVFGGEKLSVDKSKMEIAKTDAAKLNPFAGFTFGKATIDSSTKEPKPTISFGNIGQLFQAETLVALNTIQTEKKDENVANASASSVKKDDEDDYVPTAHFEPVISLPDLVEVKTGEENEIVLFEHRAKLLRYVKETKEWKERGIGNMKVMVNKDDPNKVRLLMRREQVHKLCCNQILAKDTKFTKFPKTDNAMSWYGQDYSENELQVEMLAIRFRTGETCKQFYEAILNAQKNMSDDVRSESSPAGTSTSITAAATTNQEQPKNDNDKKANAGAAAKVSSNKKGFGDQFKPKAGSWTCDACYLDNKEMDKKCAACNTPKDKDVPAEESTKPTLPKPKFSFGVLPSNTNNAKPSVTPADSTSVKGFGDKFKPKPGSWSCTGCYTSNNSDVLYCVACEGPKDDTVPKKEQQNILALAAGTTSKFSFGNLSQINSQAVPASSTTTTNMFGPTSGSFSFGSIQSAETSTTSSQPIEIAAPKLESKEFGFVFKAKSPGKQKSPMKPHSYSTSADGVEDISDDENVEEEENNTYFTPAIPLPDKIEIKTGEEDENVLYSHRAKLYRFKDSEWRERGLGDVKILQHNQTGRMRVVMRRDQILKICLNHALTHDIEYKPKDSKSWHFIVNDYSEGEVELDQFCLRFKTDEIAKEFKQAIDDALAGVTSKQNGNGSGNAHSVEIKNPKESLQSKQTTEESKKIVDLKLPADFFEYKNKEKCTGCRGCNADNFEFPEVKDTNLGFVDDNPLPLTLHTRSQMPGNNVSKNGVAPRSEPFSFKPFVPQSNLQTTFGSVFSAKPDVTVLTTTNSTTEAKGMFFGDGNIPFFGNLTPSIATTTSEPVKSTTFSFGQTSSIFGGNSGVQITSSDATKANSTFSFKSSPLFGASVAETTPSGSSTETASIFGNTKFSTKTAPATIDKQEDKAKASVPLFGSTPVFGATPTIAAPTTNIFGGNSFSNWKGKENDNQTQDSLKFSFTLPSSTTVTPVIASDSSNVTDSIKTISTPDFNNAFVQQATSTQNKNNEEPIKVSTPSEFSFAALAANANDMKTSTPSDLSFATLAKANDDKSNELLLKTDTSLSFAALAQSTATNANNSSLNTSANATGGFFGLSNRDTFSNLMAAPQNALNGSSSNAGSSANKTENVVDDASYDPHYEPIIPLPDEIQVSTGEENEEKLFGERAKLYRYDATNKEWKERGVGELKILHHRISNSYRLLLRREQVHKLVLNLALSADFQMNPMKQSDKAFCWVATNFAEDPVNGALESLSVRFKNMQLAQKFNETIQRCIEQLQVRGELEPEED